MQALTLEQLLLVSGGTTAEEQPEEQPEDQPNGNKAGPNDPGSGDRDIGAPPL